MVRYIIEKIVRDDYCHGVATITENNGEPKTFVSYDAALKWLIDNDKEIWSIPIINIVDYYNIKPYVA